MHITNRNKFRITRFIIFKGSLVLKLLARFKTPKKRLLIIKTDAIGDYVLFRNYLEIIKQSEKYKDFEIDLVGNSQWQELFLTFDKQFISKYWFIDENLLYNQPSVLLKLSKDLYSRSYQVIIQPTYSKTLMSNGLSALAAGKENISYRSFLEHHSRYKKKTDKFYTQLLDLPDTIYHELEKNFFFFKTVLENDSLPFPSPELPYNNSPKTGILIFAGSSTLQRNWEKEKYLEIIHRLLKYTTYDIILAGGNSEIGVAEFFTNNISSQRLINKVGKTKLSELTELIAHSNLVISNETSAVHIAAACKTPVICIQGGGHHERFTPYPDKALFKPTCVFEYLPCFNCNWNCRFVDNKDEIFPCISKISIEHVWMTICQEINL